MSNDNKVRYCPDCLGTDINYKKRLLPDGCVRNCNYSTVYKGFVADELRSNECPICGEIMITMDITIHEWVFLTSHSNNIDFILEMDKLKHDNIVDFTIKIEQMKNNSKAYYAKLEEQKSNIPKCPTCGSTKIKKISATKRYISTGILGLASGNIGKNQKCLNCGAKW